MCLRGLIKKKVILNLLVIFEQGFLTIEIGAVDSGTPLNQPSKFKKGLRKIDKTILGGHLTSELGSASAGLSNDDREFLKTKYAGIKYKVLHERSEIMFQLVRLKEST